MSTKRATIDFMVEQLGGRQVSFRQMFSEYALYCDDKTVAFVCNDTLFIKILSVNKSLARSLNTGPAYPG